MGFELALGVQAGEDRLQAQIPEEGRVERVERMREERPRNSHAPDGGYGCGRFITDVVISEHELCPLSDQVGCRYHEGVSLPYIFIQAAAAAEGETPSC